MELSKKKEKEIEIECERTKRDATCEELIADVPPSELEPRPPAVDPNSPYTTAFVKKEKQEKKGKTLKERFFDFILPEETKKKDIFDICQREPPCNLECLYGRKLDEEEERPEPDIVKGLVYTKGGAIYETIAYRLPEKFGWEDLPAKEPPAYYEEKKKKKRKPEIMEFMGPVRITVVTREGFLTAYWVKRWHAAFIQLSYLLIGSTVMCVYFYALKWIHHYSTNIHIISCTVAFQYCLPAALLLKNKFCVAGYVMSSKDQFRDSLLMKSFAIFNIFAGVGIISHWRLLLPKVFTPHSIPGFAACAFAVVEFILFGVMQILLGHDKGHVIDCYLHILTMAAIISSFSAFVSGILDHYHLFRYYRYKHWYIWIIVPAVLFSITALFRPTLDCLFHVWRYICKIAIFIYKIFRPHDPCTARGNPDYMADYNPYNNPFTKKTPKRRRKDSDV